MDIFLTNTLSRKKELFKPLKPGHVGMYTCGPTVYNYPHIGNCRAYVFTDILKRVFLYNGYRVHHVMNLTDVDDKTIRDSQVAQKSLEEFTDFYAQEFFKDLKNLNILPATRYPKATDHITEMVSIIEELIHGGNAYKSDDGSVYFSVKTDPTYGKLSGVDVSKKGESRVSNDEYTKDAVQDFALWKAWSPEDGEVFWDTSLGKGRPGWHIECSAMSMKYLGNHFDIHTGGIDLVFPHHENEIAQSTCATHEHFVNYWLHNEHVRVDGQKMSKSLGNFYTLRDVIEKGYSPVTYRMFLLHTHYKSPVNFTWEALQSAQQELSRLAVKMVELFKQTNRFKIFFARPDQKHSQKFLEAINDDLNTPRALAVMYEMLADTALSPAVKLRTISKFDKVFGIDMWAQVQSLKKEVTIPNDVQRLLDERKIARQNKDWKQSDALRDKIRELGFEVKDLPNNEQGVESRKA